MPPNALYKNTLDESNIRILEIVPGEFEDKIECYLRTIPLVHSEPYDALSYVWASDANEVSITCNGIALTITANLADAIKRIRDTKETKVFWADAICINQTKVEEKNAQVRIMENIYKRARAVFIWL